MVAQVSADQRSLGFPCPLGHPRKGTSRLHHQVHVEMHNGIIRLIRQYRESHDTLPAFADAVDLHHESNRFFDTIGPYFWTLPSDDWVDVLVNPHNKDKKYREKYKDWKHDWPRFLEYAKSSDRNQ